MLIGEDDEGLAAVAWAEEVTGPEDVFFVVAAVEERLRDRGGSFADEMMKEMFDRLASRADAAGEERIRVYGRVHYKNRCSQLMCERANYSFGWREGEYEIWAQIVPFEPPENDSGPQPEG